MDDATPGTSKQSSEDTKPAIKQEAQKETETKKKPVQYFHCSTCHLREKFDYYGNQPPKMKHFKFSENCYVMVDPFVPPKEGEYIVLGAHCVTCNRTVCKEAGCSFYFGGTYCVRCAKECTSKFPKTVQERVNKIIIKDNPTV